MSRLGYQLAQLRHTLGKASKDPSFRVLPAIRLLRDVGNLCRGSEVLDLGPRNRIEPDLLEREGWAVTAVDLWPLARGIRRADMHALPFPDESYDCVFASHVLEHAHTPAVALTEVCRVLRPRGLLWAAFPVGFRPNAHDITDYGSAAAFVARLPRAAWALWEEDRPGESRVLVGVA